MTCLELITLGPHDDDHDNADGDDDDNDADPDNEDNKDDSDKAGIAAILKMMKEEQEKNELLRKTIHENSETLKENANSIKVKYFLQSLQKKILTFSLMLDRLIV